MSERGIDHIEELVAEIERLGEINRELVETHNANIGHSDELRDRAVAAERALADERAKVARIEALHVEDGEGWCADDGFSWPCRTYRALAGDAPMAGGAVIAQGWCHGAPLAEGPPMPHAHCPECLGAIGTHRTTCSLRPVKD